MAKDEQGPVEPNDEKAAEAAPAAAALTPEELEQLRTKAAESDALRDKWLRSVAEFENYQKRQRREQERFREEATRSILKDLTVVMDNLDFALANATSPEASVESIGKGVALVREQLLGVLAQRGCEPLGVKPGDPFDAEKHEAVGLVPEPGLERDEVGLVARQGYKLGGTVLRPAAVQVKKAAPRDGTPA